MDKTKATPSDSTEKFPSLASSQLQELRGVIKNPLGGRHVMIPLTSKAFVVGSLTPSKNTDGEEQILVRHKAGAELQTCLRRDVCDELENERQQRRDKTKAQKAKKSASSKGADNKQNVKKTNNKTSTNAVPQNPPENAEPSLPYFEIKEEIDGAGKVVRAETINVTKQLELVAQHADESREGESKDDSNMDMENDNDDEDFNEEEVQVTEEPAANSIPDEQEYATIAARLDELARLEEEADATSSENKISALRLQSKGWSKGFLGGGGSAKKKQPVQQKKPTIEQKTPKPKNTHESGVVAPETKEQASPSNPKVQVKDKGGWSKGFLNKNKAKTKNDSGKKKAAEVRDSTSQQSKNDGEHSRKVSFHENVAEVREIPRVGNVSVASLKKPPPAPMPSSTDRTTVRPFDSTVFSGVVQERPISVAKVGGSQNLGQPPAQTEQPKKKLSKFAQERMENHGQPPPAQTEQPKKKLSKFAQERMENHGQPPAQTEQPKKRLSKFAQERMENR